MFPHLLFTAFLVTVLKILTYALVSTWSSVSSGYEHIPQLMQPWSPHYLRHGYIRYPPLASLNSYLEMQYFEMELLLFRQNLKMQLFKIAFSFSTHCTLPSLECQRLRKVGNRIQIRTSSKFALVKTFSVFVPLSAAGRAMWELISEALSLIIQSYWQLYHHSGWSRKPKGFYRNSIPVIRSFVSCSS